MKPSLLVGQWPVARGEAGGLDIIHERPPHPVSQRALCPRDLAHLRTESSRRLRFMVRGVECHGMVLIGRHRTRTYMLQGTGMGCKVRACAAKSTTRFFSKTFPVSAPPGKQIRWKTTAEMACNDEFGPSSASDRSPPLLARTLLLGMFSGYAGRGRTLLFLTSALLTPR